MSKTTFEYLVKKQQSRYNRALDKVAKEKRGCVSYTVFVSTHMEFTKVNITLNL